MRVYSTAPRTPGDDIAYRNLTVARARTIFITRLMNVIKIRYRYDNIETIT